MVKAQRLQRLGGAQRGNARDQRADAQLQLEPRERLAKVNTEEAQQLAARFNIRSIPTLALFQGGREIARQAGAMTSPAQIAGWVRQHVR